jgi:hypothetical protein
MGIGWVSHSGVWLRQEVAAMRQATTIHRPSTNIRRPSLVSNLSALAGLYRTVFWMIGRKAQYGRIWPPEADMGKEDAESRIETPVYEVFEANARSAVEVGARE